MLDANKVHDDVRFATNTKDGQAAASRRTLAEKALQDNDEGLTGTGPCAV